MIGSHDDMHRSNEHPAHPDASAASVIRPQSGALGLKVCVYGAGAVGGHIAARLARGGAEVSVVARGPHLEAMRARGIVVRAKDAVIEAQVTATDDPALLGLQDLVVVVVKAPALPSVAAGIAPLLGADTPVVLAINGIPYWYFNRHGGAHDDRRLPALDPDDTLRRAVAPERVVGGVIYSACTVSEPGVITVENARSRLVIGGPDGATPDRLQAIAAPLRAGGMDVDVTDRIRDAIWAKLVMNLSGGPIAVLTASAPRGYAVEPVLLETKRRIAHEALAVASALGCRPEIDIEARVVRGEAGTHKASILQDLELGRPMEIDGIFGTVLELARLTGVETPTLDLLVALMRVRAREAGLYAR